MLQELKHRVERLEMAHTPPSVQVVAMLQGKEVILTAAECVARHADFLRVESGARVGDIDLLLNAMYRDIMTEESEELSND